MKNSHPQKIQSLFKSRLRGKMDLIYPKLGRSSKKKKGGIWSETFTGKRGWHTQRVHRLPRKKVSLARKLNDWLEEQREEISEWEDEKGKGKEFGDFDGSDISGRVDKKIQEAPIRAATAGKREPASGLLNTKTETI